MPGISLWLKSRLTLGLIGVALICLASMGWALPRTPVDASEVLERLAVKAGDPDASRLKQYQQAVNRNPRDAQMFAYWGQTAEQAGQRNQAILAYQRFLQLAPDDTLAPDIRNRLKDLAKQPAATG